MTPSVGIIGGGITGLTAAFRLRQKGIPAVVYEAAPRAGGVIQTVRQDGYLAECGPNSILETSPKIGDLIRDLGLEQRRCDSNPEAENRYLARDGKPVCLPSSPLGFPTTKLFSLGAKLALIKEPFVRRCAEDREESVAEFVRRRLGQEFLDYAINPMVAGIYAGDPAKLSVKHAFPKLHALEQKYGSLIRGQILGARERKRRGTVSKQNAAKLSFDEGLQALTDALGETLGDGLRLDTPVTKLDRGASGWTLRRGSGEGGSEINGHAAVFLALPSYRIADLELPGGNEVDHRLLAEIEYPPVASLVLGFRREDVAHPLNGFGVLIPEVEQFDILGAIFSSTLFPGRAPEGHVTLTCYLGGKRNPQLVSQSVEEQIAVARKDLQSLLGVTGEPTFVHYHAFPKAIPQYNVGYGRYKKLMNDLEAAHDGLFLGGHYRDGISLADSIVAGEESAERMAAYVRGGNQSLKKSAIS